MSPRLTFVASLSLLAAIGSACRAQERVTILVVPPLRGAVVVEAGLEGRLGLLRPPVEALPETLFRGQLGYLHYLRPHGQLALGGVVAVASSLADGAEPLPEIARVDFSAVLRARPTSVDFFTWTVGAALEGGPVVIRHRPGGARDSLGTRVAAVLETGPGLLWHLSPYLFAQSLGRLGVEWAEVDGERSFTVIGGLTLTFDLAFRAPP